MWLEEATSETWDFCKESWCATRASSIVISWCEAGRERQRGRERSDFLIEGVWLYNYRQREIHVSWTSDIQKSARSLALWSEMSVPCMLPKCGNAVSRPTTVVAFAKSPSGRFLALTHPKMVVVALPSQHHHQGSWSRCVTERNGGRDSRITASAAPCEERLESSSSSSSSIANVGGFGGGGVAFESNLLQDLRADLVFEEGRSPNLIRAAAYLRALCFYTYPEGRSEEGLKVRRLLSWFLSLSLSSLFNPRVQCGLLSAWARS